METNVNQPTTLQQTLQQTSDQTNSPPRFRITSTTDFNTAVYAIFTIEKEFPFLETYKRPLILTYNAFIRQGGQHNISNDTAKEI